MKIVCHINKTDTFEVDEQAINVDFFDSNSFSYTFWKNKNKLPYWYSQQALDLLYISMAVFAADRLCLRKDTHDGWSREFSIYMPILEYDMWQNAKSTLEEMLNFLSGDKWTFIFRRREQSEEEKINNNKWEKSKQKIKSYDQICMFSGGIAGFDMPAVLEVAKAYGIEPLPHLIDLLVILEAKELEVAHKNGQ